MQNRFDQTWVGEITSWQAIGGLDVPFSNNNVPLSIKKPRVVPSEGDMGHGATSDADFLWLPWDEFHILLGPTFEVQIWDLNKINFIGVMGKNTPI
jgi:hypothetical protein